MVVVPPDDQDARCFAVLFRRQPLLRDDSVDLVVVWNDAFQGSTLALLADKPLKSVTDQLSSIIEVEDRQLSIPQMEPDFQLKLVVAGRVDACPLLGLGDCLVDLLAPLQRNPP
jgi:hypothetical protein